MKPQTDTSKQSKPMMKPETRTNEKTICIPLWEREAGERLAKEKKPICSSFEDCYSDAEIRTVGDATRWRPSQVGWRPSLLVARSY